MQSQWWASNFGWRLTMSWIIFYYIRCVFVYINVHEQSLVLAERFIWKCGGMKKVHRNTKTSKEIFFSKCFIDENSIVKWTQRKYGFCEIVVFTVQNCWNIRNYASNAITLQFVNIHEVSGWKEHVREIHKNSMLNNECGHGQPVIYFLSVLIAWNIVFVPKNDIKHNNKFGLNNNQFQNQVII